MSGGGAGPAGGLGGIATGGSDAAGAGAGGTAAAPELSVLYADRSSEAPEPSTESKSIRPVFVIENQSAEPVLLSELRLRYYYRLEAAKPEVFECEFVHPDEIVNDCDGVLGSFGTVSGAEASHYFELGFAPPAEVWSLPAFGGQSGRILVRVFKEGFARQDQTNDYSYDPTKLEPLSAWDRVTLYRNDELVFGVEPE